MAESRHIIVIGGGVIGLSTAFFCQQRGHRVTVIDRNPQQRDGCSYGNAGMVVPSHFIPLAAPGMVKLGLKWMWNPESPFYIKPRLSWELLTWGWQFWKSATRRHVDRCAPLLRDLNFHSRSLYEDLAARGHEFGLVTRGLVMLCREQRTLDEEGHVAEQARALGVPAEVLDRKGIATLEPGVTMNVAGGVYFPKDCHLSPGRFMGALESSLAANGARFLWNTEVTGFSTSSGRITAAKTSGGDIEGDEFLLAGGSWSPLVVRDLGLKIPMQAGKGYSLTVEKPRELPEICSILTEARVAVTPMGGALRFGGTMEIAGLSESVTLRRVRGIVRAVPNYYPAFREEDFSGITPWRGLRPCSPDGMPYMGRTAKWKNLTIATGHAMMGLSLAPGTGKLMAQTIDGEKPDIDLTLLNPDRFA